MAKEYDFLVVGLGNPGQRYENTRHNIGWMVVEALAKKYKKELTAESSIYYSAELRISRYNVLAVMPTTYMNASGEAVRKVCSKFNIPFDKIIVINDEYNFPVGKVHLKQDGGDGGHNGILSIIEELQATNFFRLRCGIGNDFPPGGMVDYVLSRFTDDDEEEKHKMISNAVESIITLLMQGKGRAMSLVNSGKLWKPKEEKKPELNQKKESNDSD